MRTARILSASTAALSFASPGVAQSVESPAWDTLAAITVEEIITDTSYEARKTYPSEIEGGVAEFDITGFAVPLGGSENVREFMIVSDMGFCPFCGDPEHATALQVTLTEPIPFVEDGMRLSLRGALEPIKDPQTFQSVILRDAVVIEG